MDHRISYVLISSSKALGSSAGGSAVCLTLVTANNAVTCTRSCFAVAVCELISLTVGLMSLLQFINASVQSCSTPLPAVTRSLISLSKFPRVLLCNVYCFLFTDHRHWCNIHNAYRYLQHTAHSTPYTAHCTPYTTHSTLHTAHSTRYTAHSTLHTVHCTQHTVHCTQHTVHCTQHTAHRILHTAHRILHTAHSTLHTVYCTLHTAHRILHAAHCTPYTAHSTLQAIGLLSGC